MPQHGQRWRSESSPSLARALGLGDSVSGIFLCLCSQSAITKSTGANVSQPWLRRCHYESSRRLLPDLYLPLVFVPRERETMILRAAKLSLVLAVALFYTFVVFNNLT